MKSQLWWKWLVIFGLVVTSIFLCTPATNVYDADGNLVRHGKIRLGLDLDGGTSFALVLDEEELRARLEEENPDAPKADIDALFKQAVASANETAVEIVRNRIDSLGTEEPVITKGQDGRIYVEIPGATAEQREQAERMIKSAAFLEFYLVATDNDEKCADLFAKGQAPQGYQVSRAGSYYVRNEKVPAPDPRALRRFGNPGPTKIFLLEKDRVEGSDQEIYRPLFVERKAKMTGAHLSNAGTTTDDMSRMVVTLAFDSVGTKQFAQVTGKYAATDTRAGRYMAIVLDGVSYSHPYLKEPITGGHAVISGSFTYVEATMLKNVLNAGAMPAPLKMLSKRFVSPTLGEDSIRDAKTAILVGVAAVLLFMLLYYRAMGLVADLAMALNFILLPLCAVAASGLLSQVSGDATLSGGSLMRLPVLTLPGIAGLLLSVGMAVDANVLIYERTREELKAGRPGFPSIMAGYQRAFSAIFDGNITTVLTGVILFVVGTGLVRGFAVTLVAGIVASMFTALFVTKVVFQSALREDTGWKPTMMQAVKDGVDIPFIANFRKYLGVSVAIIVLSLGFTVFKGMRNVSDVFAVDFTGGAKVSYSVQVAEGAERPDRAAIVAALQAAGIADADPQYQEADGATFLEIKTVRTDVDGVEIAQVIDKALKEGSDPELAKASFTFLDIDSIGSQVGREMKRTAFKAIGLATLMMLVYIGFRFEFGFGLGAVVALVHDVLITIGLFGALPFQFNLTIVAALLTIVGYGVNDTIVLFDRVREELKRDQKSDFPVLVNRCVNATLSRTVLTSVTTLLPVVALIGFCSGDIRGFGVCMLIGLVTSTFSSVFVAAPVMLAWYRNKRPDFRKGAEK
jgi:protein-export membrane protein SecD/preprotein translocase SecF subunit